MFTVFFLHSASSTSTFVLKLAHAVFLFSLFLAVKHVKRTPQDPINEFIIQKFNPLVVADFRFLSAFLCE